MVQVNPGSFHEKVIMASYSSPVLVQFWAPWCSPCHALTATIDKVSETYHFPVSITGVDVDKYTELALGYKVMGVPHTKVFVSGFPVDQFSDPLSAHEVTLFIKNSVVWPYILRYSHYVGNWNKSWIMDLESEAANSRRQSVYLLTLARYYFFTDLNKSLYYLNQISEQSDQFEEALFIRDLYPLMELEYSYDGIVKKLWAAKNALMKRNFESTYQFLLQANKISSNTQSDFSRLALLAYRQFLGEHHELNRKYQTQFNQIA